MSSMKQTTGFKSKIKNIMFDYILKRCKIQRFTYYIENNTKPNARLFYIQIDENNNYALLQRIHNHFTIDTAFFPIKKIITKKEIQKIQDTYPYSIHETFNVHIDFFEHLSLLLNLEDTIRSIFDKNTNDALEFSEMLTNYITTAERAQIREDVKEFIQFILSERKLQVMTKQRKILSLLETYVQTDADSSL